jgi:hypothetical protein
VVLVGLQMAQSRCKLEYMPVSVAALHVFDIQYAYYTSANFFYVYRKKPQVFHY